VVVQVIFQGWDRLDGSSVRAAVREAHRTHIRQPDERCRCILGGPLMSASLEMVGTLLVFDATDPAAVRDFMARDPYMVAGLFDRIDILEWRIGLGTV
jgi:uncharacterized protein YciI